MGNHLPQTCPHAANSPACEQHSQECGTGGQPLDNHCRDRGAVKDCRFQPTERAWLAVQAEPRAMQGQEVRAGDWAPRGKHPARVRAACGGRAVSGVLVTG